MNNETLKQLAYQAGADLVGVAPYDRWADWPAESNPLTLMPACRSVVVVGCRILRGTFRGVEEGTNFNSTYGTYGAGYMERVFMPKTVQEIAAAIEREGSEALPMVGGTAPGSAVRLDTKALAHAAGLGMIGKGGFFLTPKYGHRQRLALILTDLELAGDSIYDVDLCEGCDACLRACPLQAISDNGSPHFTIDTKLCELCANGKFKIEPGDYEPLDRMPASCGRACLVALEEKISNRFAAPFRRRAVWTRDVHGKYTVTPLTPNA